jgi:serine/threonine protein kinase
MTAPSETPRPVLTLHDLPDETWARLEDVLGRFEAAWQNRQRPDPAEFLRGVTGVERDALLEELVHEDLEYRLRAGDAARVEDYLQRFPELQGRPETVIDLLAAESFIREAAGQAPTLEEHRQRFPEHADTVTARIDLLRRHAGAAPTASLRSAAATDTVSVAASAGVVAPPTAYPAAQSTRVPEVPVTVAPKKPAGFPPQPLPPGVDSSALRISVPGYEVIGFLGRGGMGIVLQARQISLGRLVALKIIRDAALASDEERRRFRAEAEAIARMQHPNVIHIYDIGEHDGLLHMALEFCPGGSLEKRLGGQPQRPDMAASLIEALARGIHAAHQKGVIHRDLKPANVLLAEDGTPKITDFGLVKRLDTPGQTSLGVVLGTPSYMAPEQAGGQLEIGPAADIYALGAVLYELLTGRPPFRAATALDTVLQVLDKQPVPPSQLTPNVPPVLEAICLRCLQKAPEDRYASALELAEALRDYQQGHITAALPMAQPLTVTKQPRRSLLKAGLTIGSVPGGGYGCAAGVTFGVLLIALTGFLMMYWNPMARLPDRQVAQGDLPPSSSKASPPRDIVPPAPAAAPLPLRIKGIDIKHIAREGKRGRDVGMLGKKSYETHQGDGVEVTVRLSRPAYAYLIAFRPDGEDELCFPENADEPPPLTDSPRYPSKNLAEEYGLDEGVGLAVFAVAVSSKPLPPYRQWKAANGPAKWGKHDPLPGLVLWYDGESTPERWTEDDSATSRAKREAFDTAPLVHLVDSLRHKKDIEAAAGLGFAVLPKSGR